MMLADEEIDAIANSILTDDPVSWWCRMSAKVIAANNAKVLADLKPAELALIEGFGGDAYRRLSETHDPHTAAYSPSTVSALIQERDALAARVKELEVAATNYMRSVDVMNAAMKDGCNVHGAISSLIGATDNLEHLLKATP